MPSNEPRTEIEVLSEPEHANHIEQFNIPGVPDGTVRLIYDPAGRAVLDVSVFRGPVQGEPPDTPLEDADDFVLTGTAVHLPHYQDIVGADDPTGDWASSVDPDDIEVLPNAMREPEADDE